MEDHFSLHIQGVGKKFYQRWLFRQIEQHLNSPDSIALIGSNGSGKSTLLRIIAGQMNPSEGKVMIKKNGQFLPVNEFYQYISWAGPYLEVYKELNIEELLDLHFSLKKCSLSGREEVIKILNLVPHRNKKLQYYSSGMLQRAVVGMALFSQTPILLLDEPTSFMDEKNASMMLELIESHTAGRILVLASNMAREFGNFQNSITLG